MVVWNTAWLFLWAEYRRWSSLGVGAFVLRTVRRLPGGRVVLFVAALSLLLFFSGSAILLFVLTQIGQGIPRETVGWILMANFVLIFLASLFSRFPRLLEAELVLLRTIPNAFEASLLGRLVWEQVPLNAFSIFLLCVIGLAGTGSGKKFFLMLPFWLLCQLVVWALGILLRIGWEYLALSLKHKLTMKRRVLGKSSVLLYGIAYFLGGMSTAWIAAKVLSVTRAGFYLSTQAADGRFALTTLPTRTLVVPSGLVILALCVIGITLMLIIPHFVSSASRLLYIRVTTSDGEREIHPHVFRGGRLRIIMQKDLLHLARTARSRGAVAAFSTGIFTSGLIVGVGVHLPSVENPWGLLLLVVIGTYVVTYMVTDIALQSTGPQAEGYNLDYYQLSATPLNTVVWAKVLLQTGLMAWSSIPMVLGLLFTTDVPKEWVPAVILAACMIPLAESCASSGVATIMTSWRSLFFKTNETFVQHIVSGVYFILLLEGVGVPAVMSLNGRWSPALGFAYLVIVGVPIIVCAVLHVFASRLSTRY